MTRRSPTPKTIRPRPLGAPQAGDSDGLGTYYTPTCLKCMDTRLVYRLTPPPTEYICGWCAQAGGVYNSKGEVRRRRRRSGSSSARSAEVCNIPLENGPGVVVVVKSTRRKTSSPAPKTRINSSSLPKTNRRKKVLDKRREV